MRDQYRVFIFTLVFILTAPVVWPLYGLGTAIKASLIVALVVEIVFALGVYFIRIGNQTENRNDLMVGLVSLAVVLLLFFVL